MLTQKNPGCNKLFKYVVQLSILIKAIRNYHTPIRKVANNMLRNRETVKTFLIMMGLKSHHISWFPWFPWFLEIPTQRSHTNILRRKEGVKIPVTTKMWSIRKHSEHQTERRPCDILENRDKMMENDTLIPCAVRNLKNLRIPLKYHFTNANNCGTLQIQYWNVKDCLMSPRCHGKNQLLSYCVTAWEKDKLLVHVSA